MDHTFIPRKDNFISPINFVQPHIENFIALSNNRIMKNILCFGDSNTYGYNPETGGRYTKNERWSGILKKLLGVEYNVIEDGRCSRTILFKDPNDISTCGINYLPYCLLKNKPIDLVIIALGLNDFQSAYNASVDDVIDGVKVLCDLVKNYDVSKILLTAPAYIQNGISNGSFGCLFDERSVTKSVKLAVKLKDFSINNDCFFFDFNSVAKTSAKDCLHMDTFAHKQIAHALSKIIPNILIMC